MKSLIAVLALCVLACAQRCPKSTELTEDDIKSVDYVAEVEVTQRIGNFYHLVYDRYFDVPKPAPEQWEILGTVSRKECLLDVDASYVLGCKRKGRNNLGCFARRSEQLTRKEKELLKIPV